jgi:hypothetical protein
MNYPLQQFVTQVMILGWFKDDLDFMFLQKEYTCQNCQTLNPFQDIFPLHYHIFSIILASY